MNPISGKAVSHRCWRQVSLRKLWAANLRHPLHTLSLDLPISFVASHIAQTLTSKTESLGMFESVLSKLQDSKTKHGTGRTFAYRQSKSMCHCIVSSSWNVWLLHEQCCKAKTVAVLDVALIMNHDSNHIVAILFRWLMIPESKPVCTIQWFALASTCTFLPGMLCTKLICNTL